ncbi:MULTISPECIES: cytochrome P460 family protein [Pseudomonas]|uniref:Cytochrome C n=1 Tax=Pseudomonas marincola TaxID=437900 RepID=A0A1I7CGI5_9PSED|nr:MULTISPECIES: cytochrome P460 family protein [Pseudomonas]OEO24889.1 cytochrome C [Pseudomonas sp. J237]CAE6881488.1 Cytochrome C [Pseudomonas marincola]SFT98503.1 Cytochrome P460 [Pseudomonas marincola]
MKITNTLTSALIIASCAALPLAAQAETGFSNSVDAKGNISLPADFRATMVHLGSWYVPEGGASGFHDVYLEPDAVGAFRKTGKFPDGAVMIKELRHGKEGDYTTGKGVKYAGDVKQTFVMVKDSTNRFAEKNPMWGEGWGWALFKGDNAKNVATDYKKDCLGCHVPAKKNDWVYTEAYPTLTAK